MGRFEHLEMGDWRTNRSDADEKPSGVIDQDYYLGKAREAFAAESYEQALSYYSRTLQYEITIEEAWLGQLRCLIELGELPEAVIWSNRALERFPKSAPILSARGVTEARMGRSVAALAYSDSAFAGPGVDAYAWIARGDVLNPVNPMNAKACFSKAVELAPSDWLVRATVGRAYLVRKQYHQALEHYRQAVRLDSERFTCWYWIGRCSQALGQTDEARIAYRRALEISPSFTPARNAAQEIENRGVGTRMRDAFRRVLGR